MEGTAEIGVLSIQRSAASATALQPTSELHVVPGLSVADELVVIAQKLARLATPWPDDVALARRCWHVLDVSETYEAWIIAWPSGGDIDFHDHGGVRGAVAVVSGELVETSVTTRRPGDVAFRSRTLRPGTAVAVAEHRIHGIVNAGRTNATSVHVYSPRLTSMSYYRVSEDRLEKDRTLRYRTHRSQR